MKLLSTFYVSWWPREILFLVTMNKVWLVYENRSVLYMKIIVLLCPRSVLFVCLWSVLYSAYWRNLDICILKKFRHLHTKFRTLQELFAQKIQKLCNVTLAYPSCSWHFDSFLSMWIHIDIFIRLRTGGALAGNVHV